MSARITPWPILLGLLALLLLGTAMPVAFAGVPARAESAPSRLGLAGPSAGQLLAAPSADRILSASSAGQLLAVATLPDLSIAVPQNQHLPGSIDNDRGLVLGGAGSDLWRGPSDPPGELWMVTDRGPNDQLKIAGESRRTFPVPEYTPLIVRVRVDGGEAAILDTIPIVGQSGQPATGLPNVEGHEAPYDFSGQTRLAYNPSGLDVEGLVRTPSGDFWLVEEYGPSLVHVDAAGQVLRRFVPQGLQLDGADYPVTAGLPAILTMREPNRGFEGLTLSPDGSTLYLAIQGPLANPDEKIAGRSRIVRILAFDLATEQVTAEYAYPIGWVAEPKPGNATKSTGEPKPDRAAKPEKAVTSESAAKPKQAVGLETAAKPVAAAKPDRAAKPARAEKPDTKATRVSALAPVGPSRLLVLERTGEEARLYLTDLAGATSILGSPWDDPATTPSLESLADPAAHGITPLARTPVVDLSTVPGMPEKIEGVAILDSETVAVANDNDFDLGTFDREGNNVGRGIKSQILTVKLPLPLSTP